MSDNLSIMENFSLDSLPDLDVAVLAALELFTKQPLPQLELSHLKRPLVLGSGNAEVTGRILFNDQDAVFGSESTAEHQLAAIDGVDGVVVVSASGGKHAPSLVKLAHHHDLPVSLITTTANSPAGQQLSASDREYLYPKNREPYTYNTSTYMGMILSKTQEDPQAIHDFLTGSIAQLELPDFSQYDKYFMIIPPEFAPVVRLLEIKFIELFGRQVARDIETSEYIKHATTVVPSDELFISFGQENTVYGQPDQRLFIPLPENADFGVMMAVGYFMVGQLQKALPPYFKKNIASYTQQMSKVFGQEISPIVG